MTNILILAFSLLQAQPTNHFAGHSSANESPNWYVHSNRCGQAVVTVKAPAGRYWLEFDIEPDFRPATAFYYTNGSGQAVLNGFEGMNPVRCSAVFTNSALATNTHVFAVPNPRLLENGGSTNVYFLRLAGTNTASSTIVASFP